MSYEAKNDDFDDQIDKSSSDFENLLNTNKVPIAGVLIGLIFVGVGIFLFKQGNFGSSDKIEVINSGSEVNPSQAQDKQIVVEIAGAVEKPGVYKLGIDSRVEDLLIVSGGISATADREWTQKYINRASRLSDGQKLYIMKSGEQSDILTAKNSGGIKVDQGGVMSAGSDQININTASLSELDKLPGIGQVYGQSIIDHRPYSTVEEIVSKGGIKQNVFEKIRNQITIY